MKFMTWFSGIVLTSAALSGAHAVLRADENEEFTKNMAVLKRLHGRWKVDETFPSAMGQGKDATGRGNATFKEGLKDHYIIGEYDSKSRDLGLDVEILLIMTYDQEKKKYRYWMFHDSMPAQEFEGAYDANSDALVFTRELVDPTTHAKVSDRHTYRFVSDDEVQFMVEMGDSGGQYTTTIHATYTRRGSQKEESQPLQRKSHAGGLG